MSLVKGWNVSKSDKVGCDLDCDLARSDDGARGGTDYDEKALTYACHATKGGSGRGVTRRRFRTQ